MDTKPDESLDPDLRRAPLLYRFRSALARRRVPPLDIFRSHSTSGFQCASCLDASAAALDLAIERVELLPEDASALEPYDAVGWRVLQSRALDDEGSDEQVIDTSASDDDVRVTFAPPSRFGLFRLSARDRASDELLWIWAAEFGDCDEDTLCVAARSRATFERLVAETERRHAAHERSRPGLIVIGECDERRARAEDVSWDDVLLPRALRDDLAATVREFFASRELFRRHRLGYRRGVLLAGPPGNGKTTILKAIRTTAKVPVVLAAGLLNDAKRGQLIRRAFERAAVLAPCVLCFEDLDGLVDDGSALSLFLNLLDGLEPLEGVLVVATTNRPDRIDPAIARRPSRFDRVFTIPPPDRALRELYFARALGDDAPPGAAARLAARSDGLSVAFLKEIVIQARFAAVRRGEERVRDDDLDGALAMALEHVKLASRGLEARGEIGFSAARDAE